MLLQHVFILWPLSTPGKLPLKLSISKLRQFPFNRTTKCNAQHCTSITKYNMREKKSQQNCLQGYIFLMLLMLPQLKWKRHAKKDSKCQQKWLIYSVYNGVFGDSTMNCISIQLEAITKISFTNNDKLVRIESFSVISDTYKHIHKLAHKSALITFDII